jgi:hypothetical protein
LHHESPEAKLGERMVYRTLLWFGPSKNQSYILFNNDGYTPPPLKGIENEYFQLLLLLCFLNQHLILNLIVETKLKYYRNYIRLQGYIMEMCNNVTQKYGCIRKEGDT